jgi:DNA-directed RNA polymerase omega subunit
MTTKALSRGPELDTEVCVQNAGGNRFNLVLIAAAKAREIRRNSIAEKEYHSPCVSALLEVQSGKVNPLVYLNKVK